MTNTTLPNTEYTLFLWLKEYFIPDLQLCAKLNSRYDCYSDMFKVGIELKCRTSHYDKLMIEKGKYDALMSIAEKNGIKIIYVNSTPKGVYAFYIGSIDIDWEERAMPKKTFFKDNSSVLKTVGYLDIQKSIDLMELKLKMGN